jgi:hypothetical protein
MSGGRQSDNLPIILVSSSERPGFEIALMGDGRSLVCGNFDCIKGKYFSYNSY